MPLIYLAHPQTGAIAAAEHETTARRLEARGFVRCSPALHRVLWQRKARRAFLALWPRAPLARSVGRDGWRGW